MAVVLCYGDSNTHGTVPIKRIGQLDRHLRVRRWPDAMAATLAPAVSPVDGVYWDAAAPHKLGTELARADAARLAL